jgi:tetratricopeptide (TPR) repeat protein
VTAGRESVEIYAEIGPGSPDILVRRWATAVMNLAKAEYESGDVGAAAESGEMSVALHTRLATDDVMLLLPLSTALNNLGVYRAAAGRPAEALSAAEAAVALCRRLDEADSRFGEDLAVSLNNLGTRLAEAGRTDDAAKATKEAVGILRPLYNENPTHYREKIKDALTNLANRLYETGDETGFQNYLTEARRLR